MACIPRDKVCDGYADLAFPAEGREFQLCGGSYPEPRYFLDEAYCVPKLAFGAIEGLVVAVPGLLLGAMLDRRQSRLEDALDAVVDRLAVEEAA